MSSMSFTYPNEHFVILSPDVHIWSGVTRQILIEKNGVRVEGVVEVRLLMCICALESTSIDYCNL